VTTHTILPLVTLAVLLSWPVLTVTMAVIGAVGTRPARLHGPRGIRHYWIMVPALNEAKVIRNTVTAALALHTDAAPVQVLVVDDGSDDGTADVLRELDDPRLHVLTRRQPDARQGKGAALNAGYRMIRDRAERDGTVNSTIVGVIDGDGRGAPDMINEVVDEFFDDPRVGVVQCRVRISNRRSLLAFLQDIEFACVAHAAQRFRDFVGAVGLGGNGQFVRLRDLVRFAEEPWSSCLVEDLDLGIRLHLAGVRIRYASAAVIHQQAIVHLGRLLRQRARWAQGNLQCASHLTDLIRSRRVRSVGLVDFLAYLVTPWLTVPMSILVLFVVTLVIVGLATQNPMGGLVATGPVVAAAITLWVVMIFVPGILWATWHWWQLGDEPLGRCLVAGFCYPLFLVVGVVATWQGLARHLSGRTTWSKTARVEEAAQPRLT
jgi:cellulose synthase/poly-beta-1,6-N-acetylglucosamine synthase-like glycosyltransferase